MEECRLLCEERQLGDVDQHAFPYWNDSHVRQPSQRRFMGLADSPTNIGGD